MYLKKVSKSLVSIILMAFLLALFSLSAFAEDWGSWTTKASMPSARYALKAIYLVPSPLKT